MTAIVRFADESEFECGFCGQASENQLFVGLSNVDMITAAQALGKEGNLSRIVYAAHDGTEYIFDGYTVLEYLVNEKDGVRASLRVPYITELQDEDEEPQEEHNE